MHILFSHFHRFIRFSPYKYVTDAMKVGLNCIFRQLPGARHLGAWVQPSTTTKCFHRFDSVKKVRVSLRARDKSLNVKCFLRTFNIALIQPLSLFLPIHPRPRPPAVFSVG